MVSELLWGRHALATYVVTFTGLVLIGGLLAGNMLDPLWFAIAGPGMGTLAWIGTRRRRDRSTSRSAPPADSPCRPSRSTPR